MTVKRDILPALQGLKQFYFLFLRLPGLPHSGQCLFVRVNINHAAGTVHDPQHAVHGFVQGKPGVHKGRNPHCPGQDGGMGIQGAMGGHEGKHPILVQLHRLGRSQVVRHYDNGFLCADSLFLYPLENGKQAFRDVLHICGAASHIAVLHGGEHPGEIVRRPGYGILRRDGLGSDDAFHGIPVIAVLQHHPMDFKYCRTGLSCLPERFFTEPAQLLHGCFGGFPVAHYLRLRIRCFFTFYLLFPFAIYMDPADDNSAEYAFPFIYLHFPHPCLSSLCYHPLCSACPYCPHPMSHARTAAIVLSAALA